MPQLRLHHKDILAQGEAAALARGLLKEGAPARLHTQDFAEIAWVQNGKVRLLTEDGRRELVEGDLVLIPAGPAHGWQGRGAEPMLVSVSLAPDLTEALLRRHQQLAGRHLWGAAPELRHLDMRALAELNRAALALERPRRDALAAEAFLLPLLAGLSGAAPLPPGLPDWLARACRAAEDPEVFRGGAAAFVKVAGRAHPHVSRKARRLLGMSPSDYVNRQRMGFAARRLAGSADSLAEIAADCGIPNLSHFHKLFRAHHGQTPQHYRRSHQRDVFGG
ncbi:helix-turn-helix domain-containing protein [Pseudoroseicyclus sp. CXY001]|uniref:helix-turn-helix transcriptional regulator n=1 Tax=Pseudoroseicyclus sp. CXY001 TaxID=3242492 RepID=UPI0035711D04